MSFSISASLPLRLVHFLLVPLLGISLGNGALAAPDITFDIIKTRSHATSSFTQGLEIHDGEFYESSGLYGQSYLARYPIEDRRAPQVLQFPQQPASDFTEQYRLDPQYFAEGLTLVEDKLYLLSWREKTLQIFSRKPFGLVRTIAYSGEGWGLAYTGEQLVRSDGSAQLFFHDTHSFTLQESRTVTLAGQALDRLNELEYHAGFIYANRWFDTRIYKIDPATGTVVGTINLAALAALQLQQDRENVLNGIAWDQQQQGFWITGKRWSSMTLIRLHPALTSVGESASGSATPVAP